MADNIASFFGGRLGSFLKSLANAASQASERRENMSKLEKAIGDIHSPVYNSVVSDCDYASSTKLGQTSPKDGIIDDHRHSIWGHKVSAPTETSFNNLVSDLRTVGMAAKEDLSALDKRITEFVDVLNESSELVRAFNRTHDALAAEMLAEQSSHRRFEQLVQSLQTAQSEVRAIYDAIDIAIKKATEDASSGVLKQIEDKGKSVALEVQAEIRSRTEEEITPIIAGFQDEILRIASEQTNLAQGEFGKLKEQIAHTLAEIAAASKADLDKQSSAIAAQGKKVEQTVQILSDNIDRQTSSSKKQLEETHESLLRDIVGKAHDAKAKLQIDVEETVPAMFRNSTGKSSFWKRLKWLFTGQA